VGAKNLNSILSAHWWFINLERALTHPILAGARPALSKRQNIFPVRDYNLAATLTSGQTFRWQWENDFWVGVIDKHWVRLRSDNNSIVAETAEPVTRWNWLTGYLQIEKDLNAVLASFPNDEPMRAAVAASPGLRLLRQDPWECLASFILSSTKQIVQIQQIIALLAERFGKPLPVPPGFTPAFSFPNPGRLAGATETELRDCKMGFRAPYLLATARTIASGRFNLRRLKGLTLEQARAELMKFPGVGRKIADCVLLFAGGFQNAFPVDVWIMKALRELYFPRRRVGLPKLQRFATTHFGRNAGYAQQYLFHYWRVQNRR
jgi:N-glycosylase/DNA lyase